MTVVRIRNLKRYRPRPGGPEYVYHRKTGIRIHSPQGTPEFFAELAAIERQSLVKAIPKPGTLGGLVASYRLSRAFLDLTNETRGQYDRMIEKVRPLFDMPLIKVTRPFISRTSWSRSTATELRRTSSRFCRSPSNMASNVNSPRPIR